MKRLLMLMSIAVLFSACSDSPNRRLTPRQEIKRSQAKIQNCNSIANRTARGRCLMAESRRHYLYQHPEKKRMAATRRPVRKPVRKRVPVRRRY